VGAVHATLTLPRLVRVDLVPYEYASQYRCGGLALAVVSAALELVTNGALHALVAQCTATVLGALDRSRTAASLGPDSNTASVFSLDEQDDALAMAAVETCAAITCVLAHPLLASQ
jgi:hypothetical protein